MHKIINLTHKFTSFKDNINIYHELTHTKNTSSTSSNT